MSDALLSLRHVSKHFGGVQALHNCTFSVKITCHYQNTKVICDS
ncbi:MAG: hypothetical protein ACMXYC_00485 [Candidatus Woesearchaeota archaeon]